MCAHLFGRKYTGKVKNVSFYAVRDFIQKVFLTLESKFDQSAGKGQGFIVKSGFKKIDEYIGWFKPGELVLISGWGGVRKNWSRG